jgi:hypothetical protein
MSLDQPDIWPITPGSNEPIDFAFLDAGGPEDLSGQTFRLFIAWGETRLVYASTDPAPLLGFGNQALDAYRGILTFATPLQLTLDLPAATRITFEVWRTTEGIETREHAGLIALLETVKND